MGFKKLLLPISCAVHSGKDNMPDGGSWLVLGRQRKTILSSRAKFKNRKTCAVYGAMMHWVIGWLWVEKLNRLVLTIDCDIDCLFAFYCLDLMMGK